MQKSTPAIIVLAVFSLAIGVYVQQSEKGVESPSNLKNTIILPVGRALTESPFVNHRDQPFGLDQLRGKWTILFPGFTNCPDICPTTMQTLANVKKDLQATDDWGNYQVVMMSVDPQRDSLDKLASYAAHFDPEFSAIKSDFASTERFAKQIGVVFFAQDPDTEGNYDVDHSASIILINPEAEWVGAITAPFTQSEIVADLRQLRKTYADDHVNAPASRDSHSGHSTNKPMLSTGPVQGISLSQAWIRPPVPNANSAAAYFKIKNDSGKSISIVGVKSPQFENVMIHDTEIENGIAKMVHRMSVDIPAGKSVQLAPMSTHVMLRGPLIHLELGTTIDISLITVDGGEINQKIIVRPQPE